MSENIVLGLLWLLSLVCVSAVSIAWGKAHPTIVSKIEADAEKVAGKM